MVLFKSKIRAGAAMLTTCVALAGCPTHFNAVRVPTNESDVPSAGAPYNLTFTQYEITVARRLADCTEENKDKLVVAVEVDAVPNEQPDPQRNYVIDLDSLQSAWKTSEIEIKWHENGSLASINAAADDKVGPAAVSIAKAIGKIVVASGVPGAPPITPQTVKFYNEDKTIKKEFKVGACKLPIATIIGGLEFKEQKVKDEAEKLDVANRQLESMTAVATAMGKAWGATERSIFAAQVKAMRENSEALLAAQSDLAKDLKAITKIDKIKWPLDGATFGAMTSPPPVAPGASTIKKPTSAKAFLPEPIAVLVLNGLDPDFVKKWGSPGNGDKLKADTEVFARIMPGGALSTTDTCSTKCEEDDVQGLKYRVKAPGYLMFCSKPDCKKGDENVIGIKEDLMSQLGHVYVLPLKSGLFSKKSLSATFDDAGQPTMVAVKSTAAAAAEAAEAGNSILDTFIAARSEVIPSKLDRIKAETEMLKAKSELVTVQRTFEPPANEEVTRVTSVFTADTTLQQARLANLQAHATLDAATKALAATQ